MRKFIIHHSGVSRDEVFYQTWSINEYHKQLWNMKSELGFYGGYQYTIDPAGNIVQFRKEHEGGAHTKGHNKGYIAICLQGNFLVEKMTDAQIKSLKGMIRPDDEIYRHCDLQTERICPCLSMEYIRMILKDDIIEIEKQEQIIQLSGRLNYLKRILLDLLEQLKRL